MEKELGFADQVVGEWGAHMIASETEKARNVSRSPSPNPNRSNAEKNPNEKEKSFFSKYGKKIRSPVRSDEKDGKKYRSPVRSDERDGKKFRSPARRRNRFRRRTNQNQIYDVRRSGDRRTFAGFVNPPPYASLLNINPHAIPNFSFEGVLSYARICKVYDGDTVTLIIPFADSFAKMSVRLYGIDTPEMSRTKDIMEKRCARICRSKLVEFLKYDSRRPCIVHAYFLKDDKYGRPLVYIWLLNDYRPGYETDGRMSLNMAMIDKGLARVYRGGKKVDWQDHEFDKIILYE